MRGAATVEDVLEARLRGARRVAVIGIGDALDPRDRLGVLAAREVEALRLPTVCVFQAGTVPEAFTGPVRRYGPDRILLLDAADMGARPGTLAVLDPADVVGARLSTHALPLPVVMEYLETSTKAPAILVGLQPNPDGSGSSPSAAEEAGVTHLVAILQRVLGGHAAREK